MAAGLTDHRWSVLEMLTFTVPPKPLSNSKARPFRFEEHFLKELTVAA